MNPTNANSYEHPTLCNRGVEASLFPTVTIVLCVLMDHSTGGRSAFEIGASLDINIGSDI